MKYRVYIHERGEPVEKHRTSSRQKAMDFILDEFEGRTQGISPIYTGDRDYEMFDVFADDKQYVVAIEWD